MHNVYYNLFTYRSSVNVEKSLEKDSGFELELELVSDLCLRRPLPLDLLQLLHDFLPQSHFGLHESQLSLPQAHSLELDELEHSLELLEQELLELDEEHELELLELVQDFERFLCLRLRSATSSILWPL